MSRGTAKFLALTALLLGTEVSIALYVHDSFIRPFVGDVLVVMLIYCFLRVFCHSHPRRLALGVLLFAFTVEVLQYFDYVALLHLENNRLASVIMGRTFSWDDFPAYFVGYLIIMGSLRWPGDSK